MEETATKRDFSEEIVQKYQEGLKQIEKDGNFEKYLNTACNLKKQNFMNSVLAFLQNPQATDLRSFKDWKEAKDNPPRIIRRGEKGIKIAIPSKKEAGRYDVRTVFDIAQTHKSNKEPDTYRSFRDITAERYEQIPLLAEALYRAVGEKDITETADAEKMAPKEILALTLREAAKDSVNKAVKDDGLLINYKLADAGVAHMVMKHFDIPDSKEKSRLDLNSNFEEWAQKKNEQQKLNLLKGVYDIGSKLIAGIENEIYKMERSGELDVFEIAQETRQLDEQEIEAENAQSAENAREKGETPETYQESPAEAITDAEQTSDREATFLTSPAKMVALYQPLNREELLSKIENFHDYVPQKQDYEVVMACETTRSCDKTGFYDFFLIDRPEEYSKLRLTQGDIVAFKTEEAELIPFLYDGKSNFLACDFFEEKGISLSDPARVRVVETDMPELARYKGQSLSVSTMNELIQTLNGSIAADPTKYFTAELRLDGILHGEPFSTGFLVEIDGSMDGKVGKDMIAYVEEYPHQDELVYYLLHHRDIDNVEILNNSRLGDSMEVAGNAGALYNQLYAMEMQKYIAEFRTALNTSPDGQYQFPEPPRKEEIDKAVAAVFPPKEAENSFQPKESADVNNGSGGKKHSEKKPSILGQIKEYQKAEKEQAAQAKDLARMAPCMGE